VDRARVPIDSRQRKSGSGSSTYEQMSVDTHARLVYIEFSDGLHSTTRVFSIFGRQ
jgi:hypothetical protein